MASPEVSTVITISAFIMSVLTFFIGRTTASKTEGKEAGSLITDLKYIKQSVDRIENRLTDDVNRLEGRIDQVSKYVTTAVSTSARAHECGKSAHKRIDEHLERDHGKTLVRYKEVDEEEEER